MFPADNVMEPTAQNTPPQTHAPNCLKCAHFKITWEPAFPRSCQVFGIKSRNLPALEVYGATGRHCPAFQLHER
ncbi:MAG: hypothetical protein LBS86_05440 [Treponema sp.]|jgi:hypothetical protein|nr:hypothetical protein [Treponema sp.]